MLGASEVQGALAWRGRGVGLCVLVASLAVAALPGCANVRVNVGCQPTAPTVTNAPQHRIQRSRACGVSL